MKEELELLGFTKEEAEVYLTLLKNKDLTVSRLSHITNIPRPTLYDMLKRLSSKGHVTVSKKDKKLHYSPTDPESLHTHYKEKEKIAKELVPKLKKQMGSILEKPEVQLYEGKQAVQMLLEEVYDKKNNKGELFSYGPTSVFMQVFGHWPEKLARLRVEKNIILKVITEKSKEASFREKSKNIKKITMQKYMKSMKNNPTTTYICGNMVAIITYKGNIMGVKVKSSEIVHTQKLVFEQLWKAAKK
jgi:sugar-specific transcriptional regulator TrmB